MEICIYARGDGVTAKMDQLAVLIVVKSWRLAQRGVQPWAGLARFAGLCSVVMGWAVWGLIKIDCERRRVELLRRRRRHLKSFT